MTTPENLQRVTGIISLCLLSACLPVLAATTKQFVAAVEARDADKVSKYLAGDVDQDTLLRGLRIAMCKNDLAIFDLLIDRVRPTSWELEVAATCNQPSLARRLYDKGARIALDPYLATVRAGSEDRGLLLLEFGTGLTGQQSVEGLETVSVDSEQIVLRKYNNGPGMTALAIAAERGFHRLARALTNQGADPNVRVTQPGGGALLFLSTTNMAEGATLTVKGPGTVTPPQQTYALLLALQKRDADMVKLLLDAGADAKLTDGNGVSGCQWAERLGLAEVLAPSCQ